MRRVNLLRAHGSPSRYHYQRGCRCDACRGGRAAYAAAWYAAHREERAAHDAAYYAEHREEVRAYNASHYAAHREEKAARDLRRRYHLLPGEWDAMLVAQGNSCAICGAVEPSGCGNWHTDHNHDTGLTRGILCYHCNLGIGHFRDDPKRLMAAIAYLAPPPPPPPD